MGRLDQAATGGTQKSEVTPYERFRYQLSLIRKDVETFLGGKEKADRFVRVTLNAVQRNPEMLDPRARKSLFIACLEAAQDGLLPDGSEAVFNVYNTKEKVGGRDEWIPTVQYLPMAYGLIQKMFEIPGVTFVDAVAVYEKDEFEYERGDNPRIAHVPFQGDEDPGQIIAAYVVVKFKEWETKREVMFRRDIEKVRSKSKAKEGLMWKDFYDQAAIKSVIHRVYKQLPQSERLQRALAHDNKAAGLAGVDAPITAEDSGSNLEQLVDMRVDTSIRDQVLDGAGKTVEGTVVSRTAGGAETRVDQSTGEIKTTPPAEDKPIPPKEGDPGTAEIKTKIMAQLERSTAIDTLDLAMDEVRFYKWEEADRLELDTKYKERRHKITAKGE